MSRNVCAMLAALCVLAGGRSVSAQTAVQGVVIRDKATIWRADATFAIGVVPSGTRCRSPVPRNAGTRSSFRGPSEAVANAA